MADRKDPQVDLLARRLDEASASAVGAALAGSGLVVVDAEELERLRRIEVSYGRLSDLVTGPEPPLI